MFYLLSLYKTHNYLDYAFSPLFFLKNSQIMSEWSMKIEDLLAGTLSWGSSDTSSGKEPLLFSSEIARELSFKIAYFFNYPGFRLQFWPIISQNACHWVLFKKDHKLVFKIWKKYQKKKYKYITACSLKIKTEQNASSRSRFIISNYK